MRKWFKAYWDYIRFLFAGETSEYKFVREICPRKSHFCSGKFILNSMIWQPDIGVCQYYDIDKGCVHYQRPKRQKIER